MANPALETLLLPFSEELSDLTSLPTLFLGSQVHPKLHSWKSLSGWQVRQPYAQEWDDAGFTRLVESELENSKKWPLILVLPEKSREEILGYIGLAYSLLEPNGHIVISLPNRAGASRYEKEFKKHTTQFTSLQKNRCRVFYSQFSKENDTCIETAFNEWKRRLMPDQIESTTYRSCAGSFSHGRIDPGSKMLAEHLPRGLRGKAADFGAGWGYLSKRLLEQCPNIDQLDLYEADKRALHCAEENLKEFANSHELQFHWCDLTRYSFSPIYDVIIMNPPFHSGQKYNLELGKAFLHKASGALRKGGRLYLVANRQLPYERTLTELGLFWHPIAENATYKILVVS